MEWTNAQVIKLVDLYRDRPVLWDCRIKEYKDKDHRRNALLEIAAVFGIEKDEIERKIKNLVCHFSREIKKEKESNKPGARNNDLYISKWFCYKSMLFLKDRNRSKGTTDTVTQKEVISEEEPEEQSDDQFTETIEHTSGAAESSKRRRKKLFKSPLQKRKTAIDEALSIMRNIQVPQAIKDQYSAFGEEIGMRIRDLTSSNAQKIAKHLISNILFEAEMGKYDHPHSFTTYSQPSYSTPQFSQPISSALPNSSSSNPSSPSHSQQ